MSNLPARKYRGKFQGCIGRVCQYAVYLENETYLIYHTDNRGGTQSPDFETTSYKEAEKFAGVIGYKPFGRDIAPIYAD